MEVLRSRSRNFERCCSATSTKAGWRILALGRSDGAPAPRNVAGMTVYALNLFDVADREEYLAYSKRSPKEVARHGGRVVALGQFRESVTADIEPRQVLVLVEWDSKDAFDSYCNDPGLADLHAHRENGSSSYIWHLFDRLDDLRPLLKLE